MVPRWVKVMILIEVAAAIGLVLVGLRLAGDGARAAGEVISWARPQLGLEGRPPATVPPLPLPTRPTANARPAPVVADGLGAALNRSTADVVVGQIRIITEIEEAVRRYIEAQATAVGAGR